MARGNLQQTSISAYLELGAEGLGERQYKVYMALRNMGVANNNMIARYLNLPINTVTPRVFELRQIGYVTESKKGICPITKRMTVFWRVK